MNVQTKKVRRAPSPVEPATAVADQPKKVVRCAAYTRKSTEEGLELAFNTLDAQRESAEAFIAAQRHEGWACLPDRYDDGGYTGGNLERPAMARLLADIEAGKVDCVVVYKVDRLSRSLLDFSRIMQAFDKHKVSFVSVTQQFNTTHSMGRLTLNILLSFAQFERELIGERTRDKMAAARRKGKYAGGKPILGYDLLASPQGSRLVINPDEAEQVKGIYALYLKQHALIPTLTAVAAKGWQNKRWVTRKGPERGGRPFNKTTLYKLLTNRTYAGQVAYGGQVYAGEHEAIVDLPTFEKVKSILGRNGRTNGASVKNRYGALLKGLLRCGGCDCSMGHHYTAKGGKRYRYYVCLNAQKKGWHTCQTKSVPAGEIERFVVDQVKAVGSDPAVLDRTVRRMREQAEAAVAEREAEIKSLNRELARYRAALAKAVEPGGEATAALAEKAEGIERKITAATQDVAALRGQRVDPAEVAAALSSFAPVWERLTPKEQARVIRLLVERVEYDGKGGTVAVTFRPGGVKQLAKENHHEVNG
jgi:site-specific DNA recombinase